MPVGFQDPWVVGSSMEFTRDPVSGVIQPLVDFGVIETANPTTSPTKIELKDGASGRRQLIDETITEINESYDITCRNLNLRNRAILWLANPPESFTQTAAQATVGQYCTPGHKVGIKDANGVYVYNLGAIAGVYTGAMTTAANDITAINTATKVITTTTDFSGILSDGELIIIAPDGLADVRNAGTYTVVGTPTTSTITVAEDFGGANETAVTVDLIYADTGTIYEGNGVDWEVVSLDRGTIRIVDGGAIAAAATLTVIYWTNALTDERLIYPQSALGEIKGNARIFYRRGNDLRQSVRECYVSITPTSSNLQVDDYSEFVVTVRVLNDLASATPAGRLLDFKGDVTPLS